MEGKTIEEACFFILGICCFHKAADAIALGIVFFSEAGLVALDERLLIVGADAEEFWDSTLLRL